MTAQANRYPSRQSVHIIGSMQIVSVTLKNFKAHQERCFEFQPGTNAICGENGAGKTSILEAIAWTLFNYQGDYSKDDLIRNGSGSAQVTVAFVSSLDDRTYEVQRCTQRGYTLFDPQRHQRLPYTRIRDEVLPWLRQHLGVSPGTDLPQLFARTIGVPQGTFTADFLQTTENRKAIFDAVLKVEEYKAAYKQMNSLRRYAEAQVDLVKLQIDQYEDALSAWDPLQQRHQTITQEIHTSEQTLTVLQQQLGDLETRRRELKAQADQIRHDETELQQLMGQVQSQDQLVQQVQLSLAQAQQAGEICQTQQAAYEQFQAAETELERLNQRQQQRQQLQNQQQQLQRSQLQHQQELTRLTLQLDTVAQTEAEIIRLEPLATQQEQLEASLTEVQRQLHQLQQQDLQRQTLQTQQATSTAQLNQIEQTIRQLEQLQPQIDSIPATEEQRDRLQQQLSRLIAARQFEADLTAIVEQGQVELTDHRCQLESALRQLDQALVGVSLGSQPDWGELRRTITTGQAIGQRLVDNLQQILQDLAQQTDASRLKTQLTQLRRQLEQAYQAQGRWQQLPDLYQQQQHWIQHQVAIQQQITDLIPILENRPQLEAEQQTLTQRLEQLGRPREQRQILAKTLDQREAIQVRHRLLIQTQESLNQDFAALETQLAEFADLDQQLSQQQTLRAEVQPGYTLYLQHQNLAQQQTVLQQQLTIAQAQQQELQIQLQTLKTAYELALQDFDQTAQTKLETEYTTLRSQADRLEGSLPQQQALLAELCQQLQTLQATAEKRDQAKLELAEREKARRFINFARKAYREAGPRITERYVHTVSQQADRLFRELLNRPDVTLNWTRDYEIVVQEGPNQRRFLNLSGGEQMCAALAVRLALLKVLADIDIAFFDEPTTNMDRARREGLAEAISRIKSFRQLFVISHDDTFEKVTENVITVERSA